MEDNFEKFYDIKAIEKELKKVIPKRYAYFNVEDILTADISFFLSIRADAGKTTNALLLSLVLYKLYKIRTEYLRNDMKQTTEAVIGDMFDKIVNFGYVDKLFECWNNITYKRIEKAFYLCRYEDGEIVDIDTQPFLGVISNENYKSYKSGNNPARAWFIIWDEFLDSNQVHSTLVQKLFDNISTFGRDDPRCHVMALSNSVNKYDAIFEDLCLSKEIEFMEFGDSAHIETDLGSHYFFKMLPVSEERKEKLEQKKIRFFGISKAKFAQFTGVQAWQGYNYPHIDYSDGYEYKDLYAFVFHRNKWMAIYIVQLPGDVKPLVEITPFNEPKKLDKFVYCLNPLKEYERLFKDVPRFIKDAYEENRIYMATNNIGLLFDDFLQENRIKPIKDKDKR